MSGVNLSQTESLGIQTTQPNLSLVSRLWDMGIQCRTRSDATEHGVCDQVLHCLLAECTSKI